MSSVNPNFHLYITDETCTNDLNFFLPSSFSQIISLPSQILNWSSLLQLNLCSYRSPNLCQRLQWTLFSYLESICLKYNLKIKQSNNYWRLKSSRWHPMGNNTEFKQYIGMVKYRSASVYNHFTHCSFVHR